jgi:hypothetical protein
MEMFTYVLRPQQAAKSLQHDGYGNYQELGRCEALDRD